MKTFLREKLLLEARALSKKVVLEKSKAIGKKLLLLSEWRNARTVMLYSSFQSEVQTKELLRKAFVQGKKVCLPCVNNAVMNACAVGSLEEISVDKNGFACGEIVSPLKIGLVVVPGVAFDESGNRLGRGKGFYDAFLKSVSCEKIGLAFELQVVESVPVQAHDVAVDKIITEKRVLQCVEEKVFAVA